MQSLTDRPLSCWLERPTRLGTFLSWNVYSRAIRPLVPIEIVHQFRSNPTTYSDWSRPSILKQIATDSARTRPPSIWFRRQLWPTSSHRTFTTSNRGTKPKWKLVYKWWSVGILAALRNHTFFGLTELNFTIHEELERLNNRRFQKPADSRWLRQGFRTGINLGPCLQRVLT